MSEARARTDALGGSWGWGSFGQLGHGHTQDLATPAKVAGLQGVLVTWAACGSAHTAAISDDGRLFTWVLPLAMGLRALPRRLAATLNPQPKFQNPKP